MKPILFLLNDRWSIRTCGTNGVLMRACQRRGHEVFVTDVVHLQAASARELAAEAIRLPNFDAAKSKRGLAKQIADAESALVDLSQLAAVFIRTTPGKDIARAWAHRLAIEVMRMASEAGIRVLNEPSGLQKASSKLYSAYLPCEFAPRTLVCHSLASVQHFAEQLGGPIVIKPLLGSQGRDVFFIDGPDSLNTRQVVDILGRTGYLVVQEYLPEATAGDIRVLTLGSSLVGGNEPIGIRRTPAEGERRSNISLGGTASLVPLTSEQERVCGEIAKYLKRDGILFSGLDLIGEKVVEVNVFSPSGLQELESHFGNSISQAIVDQLLE